MAKTKEPTWFEVRAQVDEWRYRYRAEVVREALAERGHEPSRREVKNLLGVVDELLAKVYGVDHAAG